MGLFRRKTKKVDASGESVYTWMTVDEALAYSRGERNISEPAVEKLVQELCDHIKFLREQQEETKYEFNQVTQYLSDIQRFERLEEHERAEITDAARMMLGLNAERVKYQGREKKITSEQYHLMEMYEDEFPQKLSELEKHEQYLSLVRDDMHSLEGEKGSISYEHDRAEGRKNFLNKLSYGVIFAALLIFIILIVLADRTGNDFSVPFFITGIAAVGYVFYYVYAVGECKKEIKNSDRMTNRANVLLNKVKIKYVNTTGVLEYSYEKYHVNSVQELRYIWENYVHQREEENRYRKNTQLLSSFMERLSEALKAVGMEKPDAWVHQPEVILDRGEMADFKDAVSGRRNKLRAQLDYNMRQQDNAMNELEALKCKYARHESIISAVLAKNEME